MNITGKTKIIPIIGNPISHVFSPPAVNEWLHAREIDAVMLGIDIAPNGAPKFFDTLKDWNNLIGCSVTFPYKQLAFQSINDATECSMRLGVVNTIRRDADGRLIGDMTDGRAMIRAIKKTGFDLKNKKAMVVGSGGGSGIAIVESLCFAGVSHIFLSEINKKRLIKVRKLIEDYFPKVKTFETGNFEADIYINATCLGLNKSDALPFEMSQMSETSIYCDVVSSVNTTSFIKAAINKNAIVVTGADMGYAQIELQMSHFGLKN